ncbi:hypothetical protein ASC95_10935 [Pelomonas sp. Root1217]|uniref:hypothetical protein n=1 Tax=Pelomonas sp. Root1217 TaxID=1736430 RepID=UPI000708EDD1|nr:hypothetical protein [Pelomonas sp. Root1217]KQV53264.1 hypothetical protein ASC95_10935 [Pelomonas sp. Root1217]
MPFFSTPGFLRVVWFSALYDLIVTAPFAAPWTFEMSRAQLSAINQALGGRPLPDFEPVQTLFAVLMGSIVMVWAVLRLRGPTVQLGRYDAVGRVLFAFWMAWAWMQSGAPVLLLFIVPEVAWAVVQGWQVRQKPRDAAFHVDLVR